MPTKTAAAKKTAAKKVAAEAPAKERRAPKQISFDKETCDQIVSLRDDEGYKWDQVAEAVGKPAGVCMLIYAWAKLPPKERVKNPTPADVVRLRDVDRLSWGDIVVRVGWPESSVRAIYEEHSGTSAKGNRIGKGGRYPSGEERPEAPAKAAGTAKKAAGATKKAAAGKSTATGNPLNGKTPEEVVELLTGKAIKVRLDGGAEQVIKVKAVKKATDATIILTDADGKARTVKRPTVFQVSKKPF